MLSEFQRAQKDISPTTRNHRHAGLQGSQIPAGLPALEGARTWGAPPPPPVASQCTPHSVPRWPGTGLRPPVPPLDCLGGGPSEASNQPASQPRGGPWEDLSPPPSLQAPPPRIGYQPESLGAKGSEAASGDGQREGPIRRQRGVLVPERRCGDSRADLLTTRRLGYADALPSYHPAFRTPG